MPERVIDLLTCWRGQVSTRLVIVVWRIAPLWLIWTIWREWSARCFEDHEKLKDGLKNILVQSLFNWTRAVNISYFSNFSYLSIFFFFFLTSLNLWGFVLLFAFCGAFFCIHLVY